MAKWHRKYWGMTIAVVFVLMVFGSAPVQAKSEQLAGAAAVKGTVYKYETPHFAIFYQTTGAHAVYFPQNVDGNGVPLAIDSIGEYAERSWRLAVDTLGFRAPIGVATATFYRQAVPAGKMSLEVVDVGVANGGVPTNIPWMGITLDPNVDPNHTGSDLLIENDFQYYSPLKPIQCQVAQAPNGVLYDYSTPRDIYKGWKVTVSHEFFHTVEFAYDWAYQYAFHEMCAVWFEIRAYPDIYQHWQYLANFAANKFGGAFASGGAIPYANHGFVREFAHVFGENSIRKIWEFRARRMFIDHTSLTEAPWFAEAMDSLGYSQYTLMKDYSVQVANLLYNQPGLLNDGGLYHNPPFTETPSVHEVSPVAGTHDEVAIGSEFFGIGNTKYSWSSIPSGLHIQIDSISAQSIGYGYLVHLPSLRVEFFDYHLKSSVLAIDSGDTGITIGFAGGMPSSGAFIRFTYAPVTAGVVNLNKLPVLFSPTRRVDIFGRPVNAGSRGLILESDGVKAVPTIRWR